MNSITAHKLVLAALFAGIGFGWYFTYEVMSARIDKITAAHAEELRQREVQRATDERTARNNERQMVEAIGLVEQEKTNEIARIRGVAAADIARLQNRPDRKPAGPSGVSEAGTDCKGSTGAELSRPDGEFLVGFAARADEQRAALSACYQAYDSVR